MPEITKGESHPGAKREVQPSLCHHALYIPKGSVIPNLPPLTHLTFWSLFLKGGQNFHRSPIFTLLTAFSQGPGRTFLPNLSYTRGRLQPRGGDHSAAPHTGIHALVSNSQRQDLTRDHAAPQPGLSPGGGRGGDPRGEAGAAPRPTDSQRSHALRCDHFNQ